MRVATISAIHTAQVCLSQDTASVPFTKLGTSLVLQRLLLSSSETAAPGADGTKKRELGVCLHIRGQQPPGKASQKTVQVFSEWLNQFLSGAEAIQVGREYGRHRGPQGP